jgi:hypothetical protein
MSQTGEALNQLLAMLRGGTARGAGDEVMMMNQTFEILDPRHRAKVDRSL